MAWFFYNMNLLTPNFFGRHCSLLYNVTHGVCCYFLTAKYVKECLLRLFLIKLVEESPKESQEIYLDIQKNYLDKYLGSLSITWKILGVIPVAILLKVFLGEFLEETLEAFLKKHPE